MKNKIVYVAVVHRTRVTFPCGIVSDLSDENRAKFMAYILYNTGIEFSGLLTADLDSAITNIVYADGSDEIYLSLHSTLHLK